MFVKVTEAAEEFVALQKAAATEIDWNSTAVVRSWLKLQKAVEEHKAENSLENGHSPECDKNTGWPYSGDYTCTCGRG